MRTQELRSTMRKIHPCLLALATASGIILTIQPFQSPVHAHNGHQHNNESVKKSKKVDQQHASKGAGKAKKSRNSAKHKGHKH